MLEPPPLPALVGGSIAHTRFTPQRHAFRYRNLQWLVDVDRCPEVRVGRRRYLVSPEDHLYGNGFRQDLSQVLAGAGAELLPADQVLVLAAPSVDAVVFNPLSVYWIRRAGSVRLMVLEVNNTYGERHCYVLDGTPDTSVDKEFYVSPFNDVSGHYRVRWRWDDRRLFVSVNLYRDDTLVLAASVDGQVDPLTAPGMRAAARRVRWLRRRVPALIRIRGVGLWLRRLPVQSRPAQGGNIAATISAGRRTG